MTHPRSRPVPHLVAVLAASTAIVLAAPAPAAAQGTPGVFVDLGVLNQLGKPATEPRESDRRRNGRAGKREKPASEHLVLRPPREPAHAATPAATAPAAPTPAPAPRTATAPAAPPVAAPPVAAPPVAAPPVVTPPVAAPPAAPPPVAAVPPPPTRPAPAPPATAPAPTAPAPGQSVAVPIPPPGGGAPAASRPPAPAAAPAAPVAAAPPAPAPAPAARPAPAPAAAPRPTPPPAAAPPAPTQAAAMAPPPPPQRRAETRVAFAPNSAELSSAGRGDLDTMAKRLAADESLRLQLNAYAADPPGDTGSQARRMSLTRALAVRAYLIDKGVRSTRLDVRALGSPQDGGPTDRVDLVVVGR